MGQIKTFMIVDEKLMPGELIGETVGNFRSGERPEGALEKILLLFRNPKRKAQRELKYYLGLIKKEPGNTFARLRLAEIYLKRGEKRKATFVYLQTAEIFSRKRLYPQAIAIYKRIQKQNPSVSHLYPKFAEICRKLGFPDEPSSLLHQGMKESLPEGMGLSISTKRQSIMEQLQENKLQSLPKTAKAREEKDGYGGARNTGELALPAQEEKEVSFDLSAHLEFIQPPECEEIKENTVKKSYGFQEIIKELKRIDAPSNAYPDFNYNMGVACREMGLIDEAIEQFKFAQQAGQKPFDAAQLLGLCFLDKKRPQEARRSFQEALKVEGIPKEKIMEVELALKYMGEIDEIKEEGTLGFLKGNKIEGQKPKGPSLLQNRKRQMVTWGSSLILPRQP